ncbi:potassium transporter Trk [Nocardioides flavus (ex Wang et al. 2016)]|uniref:Potassium transporter Trk n=1 Tax=Nocardioides flavus (ex Wang et al. 2016) TaxID=2058780 RepID=A0ABQ3HG38_9ACTN|nr:potassium transporter TrkG [Nocardioides flavus (ex Wang et al. 2016)]GHE16221.1 potassium transporter Trk [Nocardioides flavus (ex Wang et al. 2016)]
MTASLVRVLRRDGGPFFRHPAQVVVVAFALAVLVGTALLMLPAARTEQVAAPFVVALFTSTSAVCVTGLVVVDTPSYWSTFGEVVILALIQVGGFGIMTLASLLGLLVFRRLGLRSRLTAAAETKATGLGDVRTVVKGVVAISLLFEAVTAVLLTLRFVWGYDEEWGRATYLGVFHAVSAFNNAGFALYSDSLMGFVSDPWICLPIAFAVVAGGLGFPVWLELYRRFHPTWAWSMHTRMTLTATATLLVLGTVFVTASEWSNPATLGALSAPDRLLAGFFQAVMPRTAGFNSLDYGQMNDGTLLGTMILMFIGGGSAGTAGGIKVTTFVLLFFAILAEVRGESDVRAFGRRVDPRAIRQALTVALLAVGAVVASTLLVLQLAAVSTEDALFEVVSAFATVGLSTGITADLPTSVHLVLVLLMFTGRLGPITLVSALAMRDRTHLHRLPEGRPIIG